MNKIKLYWEFHKSTLMVNWLSSVTLSLIIFPVFFEMFPIMIMTGGPVLSLLYKEISRKNEYYFYYNRSLSKVNLIIVSMILNEITGLIILSIFRNV